MYYLLICIKLNRFSWGLLPNRRTQNTFCFALLISKTPHSVIWSQNVLYTEQFNSDLYVYNINLFNAQTQPLIKISGIKFLKIK